MSKLLYLDTNIYLDHFKSRSNGTRPLGEFAFQLFRRTFECEFEIVLSRTLISELRANMNWEELERFIQRLKTTKKCTFVNLSKKDLEAATKIVQERGTQRGDTIHAVLANKAGVEYLVTRNIKDFYDLNDLVKTILPESL